MMKIPVKSFFVPKDSKRKDFKSLTGIVISLQDTLTGSQCGVTDGWQRSEGGRGDVYSYGVQVGAG
jgi:hypothetical protein